MMASTLTRIALLLLPLALAGCGNLEPRDSGPRRPVDTSRAPEPVPRVEPRSKYGNPASYEVNGRQYHVLASSSGYVERGIASWYGTKFHGRRTSSGETYDMYAMSAAHKTLPIPCYARVTNLENGRSVVVRVNDRGPFHDNRLIDLSYAAANRLGINAKGTGLVEVRTVTSAEEATAQTQAANAPTAGGTPRLYLQVGAFVSRSNADQLRSRLTSHQIPSASVQQASRPEGPIYRVRIGPLSDTDEADALASRITALGHDTPQVVID
ncbi:MAG TPA: septal ring lytic transglycosylase RlpA family protein [Gammaproteobacteria bacterium]